MSFTHRTTHLLIVLACATLLLTAIFIEPFRSMDPCPMCMMQRAVFLALGAWSLIALLHNPARVGQIVYGALGILIASLGAAIAGRQIWLQHLPEDQVPACGPGLEYMLDVFPLLEVIEMAITGTGDCAKVQWSLFTITIPGWSLIAFLGMATLLIALMIRTLRVRPESP